MTKKGFYWNEQATQAFLAPKQAMAQAPVLALPNFSEPFTMETDACDTRVGAVLMQKGHPIAYMSKALGILNCKMSIYEKEFLAVIMAVDKWRPYLQRGPFQIVTDHKSLCNLEDQILTTDLQRKAMPSSWVYSFRLSTERAVIMVLLIPCPEWAIYWKHMPFPPCNLIGSRRFPIPMSLTQWPLSYYKSWQFNHLMQKVMH
uniref:Reverse transcriptase/retrotransposon-derived protein RNase H-like domain-containing protein n=1 Tax=Aegilops tauschii subsp. strangulata TaxID=200361 RepID=A0A453RTK7_AEGTS